MMPTARAKASSIRPSQPWHTRPPVTRRRILILVDHYLPGHKAGGPVRTIAALVAHLGGRGDFSIITRDRDMGEDGPYTSVPTGTWLDLGPSRCRYLSPPELRARPLGRLLRRTPHDVLYLNSVFTWPLGILPLVLHRLGVITSPQVVLAPRGQLDPGALSIRRGKKRWFLSCARLIGLYRNVTWQATSAMEAENIRAWAGASASIHTAPNLRIADQASATLSRSPRRPGSQLRVAFISRISPKKNLHGALEILSGVGVPVDFDIYGPVEGAAYWKRCQALMSGLPEHVRAAYHGPIPHQDVHGVLAGHDLFFLPTQGENFGHVILEALAAGCPVLVGDRIPWSELEQRGAGWAVPVDAVSRFRALIEAATAESPDRWAERCVAARRYATELDAAETSVAANARLFDLNPSELTR